MTIDEQFDLVEEYINDENTDDAKKILNEIINNEAISSEEKSDAFNLLGVIGCMSESSESGIECFDESVKLNPLNYGALWNIVEGFGEHSSDHQNKELYVFSINQLLNEFSEELSTEETGVLTKLSLDFSK